MHTLELGPGTQRVPAFLIPVLPQDNKTVGIRNILLIEVINEEGMLEFECYHYQGHDQQWLSTP